MLRPDTPALHEAHPSSPATVDWYRPDLEHVEPDQPDDAVLEWPQATRPVEAGSDQEHTAPRGWFQVEGTPEYAEAVQAALDYAYEHSATARTLIDTLATAADGKMLTFEQGYSTYYHDTTTIHWDPSIGAETGAGERLPPLMLLMHELGHRGQEVLHTPGHQALTERHNATKLEHEVVRMFETPIARELGCPTRQRYGSDSQDLIVEGGWLSTEPAATDTPPSLR